MVKARELAGRDGVLFRRNSLTGGVEAVARAGSGVAAQRHAARQRVSARRRRRARRAGLRGRPGARRCSSPGSPPSSSPSRGPTRHPRPRSGASPSVDGTQVVARAGPGAERRPHRRGRHPARAAGPRRDDRAGHRAAGVEAGEHRARRPGLVRACSSSARRRAGAPRSRCRTPCTRPGASTTAWSRSTATRTCRSPRPRRPCSAPASPRRTPSTRRGPRLGLGAHRLVARDPHVPPARPRPRSGVRRRGRRARAARPRRGPGQVTPLPTAAPTAHSTPPPSAPTPTRARDWARRAVGRVGGAAPQLTRSTSPTRPGTASHGHVGARTADRRRPLHRAGSARRLTTLAAPSDAAVAVEAAQRASTPT